MMLDRPAVEGVRGVRRRLRRGERLDPSRSVPVLSARPLGEELRFFDPFVQEPLLPAQAELYRQFFPRPQGSIAGEWSPNYMSDFWTPCWSWSRTSASSRIAFQRSTSGSGPTSAAARRLQGRLAAPSSVGA